MKEEEAQKKNGQPAEEDKKEQPAQAEWEKWMG